MRAVTREAEIGDGARWGEMVMGCAWIAQPYSPEGGEGGPGLIIGGKEPVLEGRPVNHSRYITVARTTAEENRRLTAGRIGRRITFRFHRPTTIRTLDVLRGGKASQAGRLPTPHPAWRRTT